jgi:hypothetical protein
VAVTRFEAIAVINGNGSVLSRRTTPWRSPDDVLACGSQSAVTHRGLFDGRELSDMYPGRGSLSVDYWDPGKSSLDSYTA